MSKLREQIKQIARKPFKTCYKCYQDLEEGKTGEIPDCCNVCELFKEWVPLDKLLGLLDGYEQKLQELRDLLKNRMELAEKDLFAIFNKGPIDKEKIARLEGYIKASKEISEEFVSLFGEMEKEEQREK